MTSYRFCRTDDIPLLVDALNRCWLPHAAGEQAVTRESFKRSIRDLGVWCSSCMVAFSGPDPIGVLIGAKRPTETLLLKIAVHPEHLRRGHGRHLLTSLGSKLAILGPPRIVAEVPAELDAARGLLEACGYAREEDLIDQVLGGDRDAGAIDRLIASTPEGSILLPLGVGDLAANALLDAAAGRCWERAPLTLSARKAEIEGLGVVLGDRIVAWLLHAPRGAEAAGREVLAFGSQDPAESARLLPPLLGLLLRTHPGPLVLPKAGAGEIPPSLLESLHFRPARRFARYAARATA